MKLDSTEELVNVVIKERRKRGMLDSVALKTGIGFKMEDLDGNQTRVSVLKTALNPDGQVISNDHHKITRDRLAELLRQHGFTPVEEVLH